MEQAECEDRLRSVDERMASGKYPDSNVATAKQMRDSILQSCSLLTEDMIDQMMEGFEQLLPTRTKEEQAAYEQARREQRRAEREAGRAEEDARRAERDRIRQEQAEREARDRLPVSAILLDPPTGKSARAERIERPDDMLQAELADWDVFNGALRLLYRSYPAQSQEGDATARVHFYAVLIEPDGAIEQSLVASYPLDGQVRGGLRRGYGEAVFQIPGELKPTPQSTLERRSLPGGELLSSTALPDLGWTERFWGETLFFRAMLEDGNLLFVGYTGRIAANNSADAADGNTLSWTVVSPVGAVQESGFYAADRTNIDLKNWAVLPGDDLAFLVYASLADRSANGIPSELDTPLRESVGSVTAEGYIFSEFQVLTVDGASGATNRSPGFGQVFDWKGLEAADLSGLMADYEAINNRRLSIEKSHGSGVKLRSSLAPVASGAGLLVHQLADPDPDPRTDGALLREYAVDGGLRQTHMQSAADHLDISFSHLAGAGHESVYVYGGSSVKRKAYVIRLNADREIAGYAEIDFTQDRNFVDMVADDSGVWIIRWQRDGQNKQYPHLERVAFSR